MKSELKQIFSLKSIIIALLCFLLGVVSGGFLSYVFRNNSKPQEKEVTIDRQAVIDRISQQGFLVTQVVIIDEEVTVTVDEGSSWSNFWWGHEVEAQSRMQVDVGIDLTEVSKEDIKIDDQKKQIKIDAPEASIYNISLLDDIEVKTKSGVLKKVFDSDKGEDFNLALDELRKTSRLSVESNEDVLRGAESSAEETLNGIFFQTGYEIILK